MRMNKTNYKQYDTRWAKLPYPKGKWVIKNCGCGEVAICNSIIEMAKCGSYTPKTIQPYCKQYAAPNGDGTYWSGIPAMMKHYGMTEVKEHATMAPLWKELAKGNRVAIYLMGSRKGGSKGVHWTSSGHFVCSTDYKYENGKHMVYVKDSNSTSSLRNGWISYEENMRNDVLKVWSGKLNGALYSGTTAPAQTSNGKLVVDGVGGPATVNRLQAFLGVPITGGITIKKDLHKYCPALEAYEYGDSGSPTVLAMQKWLGLSDPDGFWGPNTSKGLQKKLSVDQDGIAGPTTFKALQEYLNEHDKAVYPKPDPMQPWYDAMTEQYNWSKNQNYEFNDKPTVANSKKEGTCITFPAVSLQRIGLLPKKKYFYLYPKTMKIAGNGADYAKKHTEIYDISYPNKTIAALWKEGKIKKGDIVGFGNPAYHTMVFMGLNKDNKPIFNTMGHKRGLGITYSSYAKRKVNMLVHLKKAGK